MCIVGSIKGLNGWRYEKVVEFLNVKHGFVDSLAIEKIQRKCNQFEAYSIPLFCYPYYEWSLRWLKW